MIGDNIIRCPKCDEDKDRSAFRLYRGRGDKWYVRSECIVCEKRLRSQRIEAEKTAPPPTPQCECCGDPLYDPRPDHDHVTGTFRGWLCRNCNEGLGKFGDNLEGIEQARAYLLRRIPMSTTQVLDQEVEVTVKVVVPKVAKTIPEIVEKTEQVKSLLLEG